MRRFLPDQFTLLLVATVVLASLLPVTGVAAGWFSVATKCAIALLFFLQGARLSRQVVIGGLLHWRLHLTILATTFGVFPLLGYGIAHLLPFDLPDGMMAGILFIAVLPSTVQSSIAFTSMAGGNVPAAICAATASNIIGMFATPLLIGILLSASGGGFSFDVLFEILLQLLLPFVVGQLLMPWIGDWVRSHKKILSPVDRGSILMVVYLAFSSAVAEGLWHQLSLTDLGELVIINAFMLAVVLTLTMFGSRALGFSRADEIAIVFCGSKKSLASGVPMAGAIFASQGVGAVVLPLMLFHQMQLMICAVIAQHYARTALEPQEA
ncbi:bile acid:sodium symporter family protein [Martelella endophytica]|uniref:Bile acid:sodium symporter n=1 Tax=Martelella endophytica TaxID=1486262 RepID=A0A0D5LRH0_MAREN|nr:bile acid:sodium symporter family protein [Martelella endophytica]AJY45923.1 hypothetical protein TM49_09985 [Martelella endophytica]